MSSKQNNWGLHLTFQCKKNYLHFSGFYFVFFIQKHSVYEDVFCYWHFLILSWKKWCPIFDDHLNVNGRQSFFFLNQFLSKNLLAVDPGPQNSSTEVTLLYIHISVILMVQAIMPITICHSAMALCKHVFKNFNFTIS